MIRTPDDEIDKPGYFYPPFKEGWHYQGATYPGHSNHAVDFNRRTASGGWLDDKGDPVLAAADGTVHSVDPAEGLVLLNHHGGLWRTEYRHMGDITVKEGETVQRGDKIGEIGDVGNASAPHLHHVQWKRENLGAPWKRTRMRFLGENVAQSVADSDTRTDTWEPPSATLYEGPQARATWQGAYRDAVEAMGRLEADKESLRRRVIELEETPPDCEAVVAPERARADAAEARIEAAKIALGVTV